MLIARPTRRGLVLFALGLFVAYGGFACGGSAAAPTLPDGADAKVGETVTDAAGWVEYTIGDAPLVIVAPHGGLLAPSALPDRTCSGCVTVTDENTEELARRVAAQFQARTGRRVHLVISRLRRSKLDPNREVGEATGGNASLASTWTAFHAFIESARTRITVTSRRGLLLDLHGHGHTIQRLELGYLLSASDLRLSDQALASTSPITKSSISRLASDAASQAAPVAVLRGASSLGGLLARNGFPSVPSPGDPAPAVGEEYFTGGYITERHGSSAGGTVDAIQVEANRTGARDSPENLDRYAAAIVSSALEFLSVHYGWTPGTRAVASGRAAMPLTPAAP